MKKLVTIVVAVAIGVAALTFPFSAHGQVIQRPNGKAAQGRPAPLPIQALIVDFYISRMPVEVELSDEQLGRVLPLLRQWLEERRVLEPRRTRAMNQLRQALNKGGSEEELGRLTHEADQAVAEQQASHQKFLANVDPMLTIRQRAKLRVFQENIEQRIIRMIEASRVSAQQQRNAVQPPKNPS